MDDVQRPAANHEDAGETTRLGVRATVLDSSSFLRLDEALRRPEKNEEDGEGHLESHGEESIDEEQFKLRRAK